MPDLDVAAVDRDRPRQRSGARPKIGQPVQIDCCNAFQSDRGQTRHGCAGRPDPSLPRRCCDFDDEERIATRSRVNSGRKRWIGRLARGRVQHRGHRANAQAFRTQDVRASLRSGVC